MGAKMSKCLNAVNDIVATEAQRMIYKQDYTLKREEANICSFLTLACRYESRATDHFALIYTQKY